MQQHFYEIEDVQQPSQFINENGNNDTIIISF